jgi:ATP-dependent helicase/nuclease subunit A
VSPLVDQPARDAIRAALTQNLFVDASAGTGKTTELVERIVRLYADGVVEPGRLAAITFTDAAAAQLRHRVRTRLVQASEADGLQAGRERLRRALASMDDAAFTTLHGFAQRLLAEHALEAGLPPVVELLGEVDAAVAFDRRFDVFLAQLVDDPTAAGLLRRAADLGLKLSALRTLAEELDDAHDRAAALTAPVALPVPDPEPLVALLDKVLGLRDHCAAADDKLLRHLDDAVAPLRAALERVAGAEDVVRVLSAAPCLKSTLGGAKQWGGCKPQVLELLGQAQAELDGRLGAQRDAVARSLAARVAEFARAGARRRRADGTLRFHDLLVLARDLLTGVPRARAALRERYTALLLDEFQDTDPLQIQIATLLTAADGDGRPWREADLLPGRLFVVGDPKQSIYRFRRADITVYQQAKRDLPMHEVTLTQNFRCVPGIVAWVNAAFGALLADGVTDAQPAYSPLVAERAPTGERPAVWRFGQPWRERAAQVRAREAADAASAVRRVLDENWQVADPRTGDLRPARARDIAILVRRHATVRLLERTLAEAGLPYRIESKSLVYATDELRDLVTLLTALDDPADQVAVVAALRHPALGCDDRALLDWRAAGGGWDHGAEPPPGLSAHPVAVALGRLRELSARRWSFSVGGLVEHVIGELRLLELACAQPRPRDRWRRLRFLADQAHAFHDAGGSLRGFLRWVARQAEQDARVDEFLVDEPDDDAVRITTVHGAKGLEYPVVVLLGLDADPGRLPGNPRLLDADVSLGGDLCTRGWAERKRAETVMHGHEEVRLLYVGATRARDHLLVSLHSRAGARSHAAALLGVPELAGLWSPLALGPVPPRPAQPAGGVPPPARGPGELTAWRAERAALAERARRPSVVAATTIAAAEPAPEPLGEGRSRSGRAATAVGRAVHGVLQAIDLADPADLDAVARAQAAGEGLPGAGAEVAQLAAAALRAPSVRAAAASGRRWRELYVGAPIGDSAVEGFVDLVYEDTDELVVVDYKTDRGEGAAARHERQVAAYALVLEAALGRPVARCVLVFARTPQPHEVVLAGDRLRQAKAEVEVLLRH